MHICDIGTDVTMGVTGATRSLKVATRITAITRILTCHICKCDKDTGVINTHKWAMCRYWKNLLLLKPIMTLSASPVTFTIAVSRNVLKA